MFFSNRTHSLFSSDSSLTGCPAPDASGAAQKLLILDARSYTAAVANRAKGGGCECEGQRRCSRVLNLWMPLDIIVFFCLLAEGRFLSGLFVFVEYYPNCEVMFMGMANIHSIRNSFQSLRAVCSQIPDPGK